MITILSGFAFLSLVLTGAIFGFFYAWVCSTMGGLDGADPRVAIAAMQAINEGVRNAVFAPAFFGTPVILFITAGLAASNSQPRAMIAFGAAGAVYLVGAFVVTLAVNVPMNTDLAQTSVPATRDAAAAIWADYSPRWQFFNQLRTAMSGASLVLVGLGLVALRAVAP